jgi:hypothetical protein
VCGEFGQCVPLNGFPTCDCDPGYASVSTDAGLTCMEALTVHGAESLLWENGGAEVTVADASDPTSAAHTVLSLLMLAVPVLALRRRKRS